MKTAKRTLLAAVLALLGGAPVFAAFEDLGAGARAAGMGDAFVAVADDVYAIYHNPAGLALLTRPELGTGYDKLHAGLSDGSSLGSSFIGYAQPLGEGKRGTLGAAWNSFSLDSTLYREDSFYVSYGRGVWTGSGESRLLAGASLKYLRGSFGSFAEASDATNGIVQTGQSDPVLSGSNSQGTFDADLGLLLRLDPHYSLGFQAAHLAGPDVSFAGADSDKLPPALKFAANYRSLLSNLVAQIDTKKGPGGGQEKIFTTAAERWFVSRFYGTVGARGAFNLGDGEYKRASVGFSYKTSRLRVDYAFAMPIGGVSGTAGSHRFGMAFKFGRRSDEEESVELLIEAMRELRAQGTPRAVESSAGATSAQKSVFDERMAQSGALRAKARYKDSLEQMELALAALGPGQELLGLYSRLKAAAKFYPALPKYDSDPIESALHRGITAYLAGRNIEAVERVSYAYANRKDDEGINRFLTHLELETGIARMKTPAKTHESLILQTSLTKAEAALEARDWRKAIELSLAVIREDENNASAWQSLGAAYFALRDYDSSLRSWEKVLELEKSPIAREAIRGYMRTIKRLKAKEGVKRRPRPVKPLPERPSLSRGEVEELFEKGVKHYTNREYAKAAEAFEAILEAAPNHEEARKALNRVKAVREQQP